VIGGGDPAARRARLARLLREAAGIAVSSVLGRDPEAAVEGAARLLGVAPEALAARLDAGDPSVAAALLEAALVHESHFFRHPEQIEALRSQVFARAPLDRPLAVWCAGCAAGEEPYTLAIALAEAGRGRCPDRVVATDVSSRAVDAARAGLYGEWSLRQLGPARRERFFVPGPPQLLEVAPAIRAKVELRVHELVREPPPGDRFDVVSCRNVLVYFDRDVAARVLEKLAGVLAPGGVLVVSPAELGVVRGLPLEADATGGAVLLRKVAGGAEPLPARPPSPRRRRAPRRAPAQARADRAAPPPPPPAPPPAAAPRDPSLDEARAAARRGELAEAERLARLVGERELRPEAFLLVAAAADARGDLAAAEHAVRRALFLDPRHAQAHATLVGICRRLGRHDDARRARRNAIALLEGVADPVPLPGVEDITAGALRLALEEVHE
jgi:chemotaxis protein methyltransferase CheR